MKKGQENGAVLYVRVSTDEQANGPLNLINQEQRCRDYCQQNGLSVVQVFTDPGKSARTAARPAFRQMLAFCKSHRRDVKFVLVQDLSRFARDSGDQADAIVELRKHGILLRSVYERNVDETAAGKLAANMLAAFNQYFSDSLSEKMKDRTRQAAAAGRFPWRAPVGYQNIGGKVGPNIKPDDKRAPLIRRAFELMATGRHKKTDVLKIVTDEGLMTASGKRLSPQTLQAVLRNPLYAGWVTLPSDESFEPVRGLHEPLTSQDTFDRVQAILDGRKLTAAPKRKFNPAFPLKCLVRCALCDTPLTGGSCTGRTKEYGRYWCRNRTCRAVKLSAERLEKEFLALMRRLKPDAQTVSQFPKIAARIWAEKQGDSEKQARKLQARIEDQKMLKGALRTAMLRGTVSEDEYKEGNADHCAEIALAEQELQDIRTKRATLGAFVRFAELHLMDIARAWEIAEPEQRQRVQNLLFEGGLHYSPESGFLNRSKPSLFSTLEAMTDEKGLLASPTGFEPVLSP
jgi:site-specific DNA recombinase